MRQPGKRLLSSGDAPKAKKTKNGDVRTFIVNRGSKGRMLVRKVTIEDHESAGNDNPEDTERLKDVACEVKDNIDGQARREKYNTKNKGRGAAYVRSRPNMVSSG